MRQVQPQMERTTTDEDLDELPPMDGDADEPSEPEVESLDDDDELASEAQDAVDPFDDSTGEGEPVEELVEEERSWLADAEPAEGIELGAYDFDSELNELPPQNGSAIGDDEEPGVDGEDFGIEDGGGPVLLDGGEEGPSGPDEELREADLPALDADEEGDLDDALLDEVALEDDAPLPWDPSPWERVPVDHEQPSFVAAEQDPDVQEKTLATLGLTKKARDLRVTADAVANGDRLVALVSRIAGRAWLVRVPGKTGEAEARIVAEVGGAAFGDDPEILAISWDDARGVAWVSGLFGLLAFQPAARHLT
ncbi:hypothetical protein LZC95_18355 [Pendulispora brunnea]|uniref:Uncharacterized protein n=1 Tax=Pendulispora brunnea TaxID=2905690 RepID=A0ABZ2KNY5_9BACT